MKAMVYYGNQDIRFENIPEPKLKQSELKIKVDYCGICATDIEEYQYDFLKLNYKIFLKSMANL